MDDHSKIQGTIDGLRAILVDVRYDTVRETVNGILPRRDVERIEVNRISYDKMTELLSVLSSYSRDGFELFLKAVAQADLSLEQTIKDVYFKEFGCHLDIPHVAEPTEVRPVSESNYEGRNRGLVEVPEEPSHNVGTLYQEPHDQDDAIGDRREIRDVRTRGQVPHAPGEPRASSARGNAARDSDEMYEMDWNYPGLCLIINNRFSNDAELIRIGSEKDVENLEHLFKDFLKFKVTTKTDLTAEGMRKALADHAQDERTHHYSALAVVLMSHGGEDDYIYGTDLDPRNRATGINRSYLMECFNTLNCPGMKGKPKLFILQACRGGYEDTRDTGNAIVTQQSPDQTSSRPQLERDAIGFDSRRSARTSDTCFLFASSPGYVALRDRDRGSIFVQEFTRFIKDHADNKMYRDILNMLIQKFDDMDIDDVETRTMPEYTSTLTKKLRLKPPPQVQGASSQ